MSTTRFWDETDNGDIVRRANGLPLFGIGVNILEGNWEKWMVGGFKMEGDSEDCESEVGVFKVEGDSKDCNM